MILCGGLSWHRGGDRLHLELFIEYQFYFGTSAQILSSKINPVNICLHINLCFCFIFPRASYVYIFYFSHIHIGTILNFLKEELKAEVTATIQAFIFKSL